MTRLILGTAQLGSGYGITNGRRRIEDARARELLSAARDRGIDTFDTAAEYGDSQDRLGQLLNDAASARFITKFSLPDDGSTPTSTTMFEDSMLRLGVDSLHGLLFHRVDDLRDERCAVALDILRAARANGTIARIGVSIYDRSDLELVLDVFPDVMALQIPANLVDRRLIDDPDVAALHSAGVEIHVRSAFLQGLLLADPATFDARFSTLAPVVQRLRQFAEREGVDVVDVVLGFLARHPNVDAVLVGATSAAEVHANADAWDSQSRAVFAVDEDLSIDVIDPRRW